MLVSIEWLIAHFHDPNIVILDTRPKSIFAYGHLLNSQSLTLDQVIQVDQYGSNLVIDQEKIIELCSLMGIDDSKNLVIIGDYMDPSSSRIFWTFLYFGCENIHIVNANITDLQKNGFELTRKIFTPNPTKFIPKINSAIRIDSVKIMENLNNLQILDARTLPEFMSGHLPHSKLIPFTEGIGYNGKLFQDREFLQNLFLKNKISSDDDIVCYCMHGHRASSLFIQLKIAGYQNVKLYDGSFIEWYGRRLPLE